ncbi:DEAD/DEAH box helicase [Verrucomicrobiaceae bacterium N1E253]|uniref:DEAD/DEAH box helicase n=1 Tax=Oceaniferula marina TaxID=2748318 RepID=A0A851GSN2_9BACT|nr:DEAD/DEAH box helicase [Oceaniferula marina]NWK57254.1 DEAD/DEAH box helicase [Oceaniferula marina]
MEITEQWIGKASGGRVFREARSLLKSRKLIQVSRKGDVFQGSFDIGRRPMRVTVKVLGPHEVRNHCGCSMARRSGALCEHATALMLAGIMDQAPVRPTDEQPQAQPSGQPLRELPGTVDVVPMEVALAPLFPEKGAGAIHLRRAEVVAEEETSVSDRALSRWLYEATGKVDAAMLSLGEKQMAGFYRVLAGHRRVSRAGVPVEIVMDRLKPALELDLDGSECRIRMVGSSLVPLGSALADWLEDWAPDVSRLVIDTSDTDTVLSDDWQPMKTKALIGMLPALAEMYQLPDDLGGLRIKAAVPEIQMEIAGSTRALQVQLRGLYPENVQVPLGQAKPSRSAAGNGFPISSGEPNLWWVRNEEFEQSAVAELMAVGFQMLDASGLLFLRGEEQVLEFLTVRLPGLRKKWSVQTEEKLAHVESRVERIVPHVEVSGHGEDWLSCDIAWQCGDQTLSSDAVRKLLMSGSRTMAMPRGGKAVLSHFDAEVMEGLLLDTDPRQESGQYLVGAQHEAYLGRLQDYYAEGSEKYRNEDPVPALPDDLTGILREYQYEGVQWLYRRLAGSGAALLADDMGLGKTLQALAVVKLWKAHGGAEASGPALVVCPATLLGNWRDEAAKFVPDMTVLVMHGSKRKDYFEVMEAADIIITSYALLDRDVEQYERIKLGVMVLDEASAIRNPDTLAAKAARRMNVPARIAITGTPVENGVRDLWSIFQFLMPSYLGGREDFRLRYELPCQAEVPDMAAMQRLRWRTSPFMLRRTKSLVAKDLPPKMESVVWCDPSPMQKETYQSILRQGVEKVDALRKQSGPDAGRMQMLTVLLRLRQTCCDLRLLDDQLGRQSLQEVSSKLARLMELLDEAERGGHRVLVFSQFTSMLSLIRDELDREDIDFCYLDGSTTDRSSVVKRFQKPDGPPVFLISLKAGGYGLTLTAADTVVLFDPWWNPAVEAQAADRIHRIGQTKPSTIYKFITRGTVEEKILRLQERKRSVISAATGEMSDESTPMMSGLSDGEMRDLLA